MSDTQYICLGRAYSDDGLPWDHNHSLHHMSMVRGKRCLQHLQQAVQLHLVATPASCAPLGHLNHNGHVGIWIQVGLHLDMLHALVNEPCLPNLWPVWQFGCPTQFTPNLQIACRNMGTIRQWDEGLWLWVAMWHANPYGAFYMVLSCSSSGPCHHSIYVYRQTWESVSVCIRHA